MGLCARGLFDLLEDKLVEALEAYSAAQAYIDPSVGFYVTQGETKPLEAAELPLVNVWVNDLEPDNAESSRVDEHMTVTYNLDLITRGYTDEYSGSSRDAFKRLYYLVEQVRHALFDLVNADFGMTVGTIGRKQWSRFAVMRNETGSIEEQIVAGRMTLSIEYEWEPDDANDTALSELNIETGRFSALYDYTEEDA